ERIPLDPGHDEYLPRGDGKAGSLPFGVERQVERRLTRAAACVGEAPKRDNVDEVAGLLGPEFGMRERARDDERKCKERDATDHCSVLGLRMRLAGHCVWPLVGALDERAFKVA